MIDGYAVAPAELEADAGVVMTRWNADATFPLTGMARAVSAFALREGMREAALHRVETVVSHAVAACMELDAHEHREMSIEAATDGTWLSVRVTGDAHWDPVRMERRLAVASALSERLEAGRAVNAGGTSVLMELRMSVV